MARTQAAEISDADNGGGRQDKGRAIIDAIKVRFAAELVGEKSKSRNVAVEVAQRFGIPLDTAKRYCAQARKESGGAYSYNYEYSENDEATARGLIPRYKKAAKEMDRIKDTISQLPGGLAEFLRRYGDKV